MSRARIAVAALSLSASAFVGLVLSEGYVERAMIPTQNDRPTVGFGSTFHEDGTPVKLGDTTTPVRALIKAQAHISKDEARFRASLPGVALYQAEYDTYLEWGYQYGSVAWRASDMRSNLLAGNYRAACDALLKYRFITSPQATRGWEPYRFDANGRPTRWRFDCSNPGNRICHGVWDRQTSRHTKCLSAQ